MNGSEHPATEPAPKRQRKRSTRSALSTQVPPTLQPWWDLTRKQIIGWAFGCLVALIGAGWVIMPAKQSDVVALAKEMKSGFERIDAGFASIGDKFRALDMKMDGLRSDLVRVQTIQEIEVSAPASPAAAPRQRRVVKKEGLKAPPPEIKATTIFGF